MEEPYHILYTRVAKCRETLKAQLYCIFSFFSQQIWQFYRYPKRMIKCNLLNLFTHFMKKEVFYKWNTIKRHLQQIGDPIYKCQPREEKSFCVNWEVVASSENTKYVNRALKHCKKWYTVILSFSENILNSILIREKNQEHILF